MDDLASVVGSALNVKPTKSPEAGLRAAATLTPQEQAKSDAFESSPGNLAELKAAISAEKNPQNKADLQAEYDKQSAGGFGDIASVVGAALSEKKTTQPAAMKSVVQAQPKPEQGALESFGAGAGKAVGTGVLALQQLAGKGISALGSIGEEKNLSSLVAPQRNTVQKIGDWLSQDAAEGVKKLEGENAPYAESNPKTNFAGELTGTVLSPVNKLVPGFGGPAASLTGTVLKSAAQGAVLNTLTAPVTDDGKPFVTEKLKQAGIGAVGGTVGGLLGSALSKGIDKTLTGAQKLVGKIRGGAPDSVADEVVSKSLAEAGLTKENITPELFDGLKKQVADAVKTGEGVNENAVLRLTQAQTLPVPVPMLQSHITRDAMQFAKEQNLRGIQGVGEPITETLTAQNKALIGNLDALGANKGADVIAGGKGAIDTIAAADQKAKGAVTAAYDAFKNATGRDLDVPLQGLAQDYASAVKTYGSYIPDSIRKQFESFGLMSGTQKKTFSINDAEALIKDINKVYDPAKRAEANALDDLRKAIQKSITEGAGAGAGAEAAGLAKAARAAAKARFDMIDATPAYKAVVGGVEPDKFIQKFVLQGNKAEIQRMMAVMQKENPEAANAFADSMMAHVKGRVLNKGSAENGIFSQAQLKQFVSDPNTAARLESVIGPQKMQTLRQLNDVAENALFAPKASAVNSSNTAGAAANLVQETVKGGALNKMLEIGKHIPGLSTASNYAQQGVRGNRVSGMIDEAINPDVSNRAVSNQIRDLTALGARTGAAYTGTSSRKRDQR